MGGLWYGGLNPERNPMGSIPIRSTIFLISYCSSVGQSTRLITDRSQVQILPVGPNFSNVREATVGCVAADCNPAHQKHRWFDSNRVHQFQKASFDDVVTPKSVGGTDVDSSLQNCSAV